MTAPTVPQPNARLRILYVAMRHDYGDPARGDSFEHMTFYDTRERSGHELHYFDFMTELARSGPGDMNRRLVERAATLQPDLAFFVLFKDEISPETIRRVAQHGHTQTVNWFCDDQWRFQPFSRHYAPALDWVITTDREAPAKYAKLGLSRVLLLQWACNHFAFGPRDHAKDLDAVFVGQPHGDRRAVLRHLTRHGIAAQAYGYGWPAGRVTHEQMLDLFGRAKVVLNLSNASRPHPLQVRAFVDALLHPRRSQIKGRNFEVPGCRAAMVTDYVPGLEHYFTLDEEVVCFRSRAELAERCRELVASAALRERIAAAGYRRVLGEHTYVHRFNELFQAMGLAGAGRPEGGGR
jgi:spore maturation protein CgeB